MTSDDSSSPDRVAAGDAVLVDAHAHFHPCFSAAGFLDAATRHLRRWRGGAPPRSGSSDGPPGLILMLADPEGRRSLHALPAGLEDTGRWDVVRTGEPVSRLARDGEGRTIGLVAGRQVATADGLEVLALATEAEIPDGLPTRETVEAALAAEAVTVVPWGFGKWWFGRRSEVRRLVESVDHPLFFLGDNGGRPRAAPEPSIFAAARRRRTAVLPGSDPLPFPRHQERVGSYGFVLAWSPGDASPTRRRGASGGDGPASALRTRLRRLAAPPAAFGRRAGLGRFVVDQVAMQLANRGLA